MNSSVFILLATSIVMSFNCAGQEPDHGTHASVSDQFMTQQHRRLELATRGKGFGPQSPRNIDLIAGDNAVVFAPAPSYSQMNLCNIHFHKNAEHAGGEFTRYAGNGNGQGYSSGFQYSGLLSAAELEPFGEPVCASEHSSLFSGDTIEVHYVYSTAQVSPGPTLNACFSESAANPQLRVEAQVFVVVNDENADNFEKLTQVGQSNGLYQAVNIPTHTGPRVQYAGSTTGPSYNELGSPFQVSWGVRPRVARVAIETVGQWCKANAFDEDHAHGVRNLITDLNLLSQIEP